jgi:hypothetical protein
MSHKYSHNQYNDPDNGEFTFAEDAPLFHEFKNGYEPTEVKRYSFPNDKCSIAKLDPSKKMEWDDMILVDDITIGSPILVKWPDQKETYSTTDVQSMVFMQGVLEVKTENSLYWLRPTEDLYQEAEHIRAEVREHVKKNLNN